MADNKNPRKRATPAAKADKTVSAPVETAPAADVDERDDEIAALEARLAELNTPPDPKDVRLAELRAAIADAEAANEPAADREMDARDRTIAKLRRDLEEARSTPQGAAAEMAKALAALQAQVEAMKTGTGKVAVPINDEPDPYLYGVNLSCGCVALAQHPHATHSFCAETDGSPRHGTVQVKGYWTLAEGEKPSDTHAELARLREEVKGLRGRVMGAATAGVDET